MKTAKQRSSFCLIQASWNCRAERIMDPEVAAHVQHGQQVEQAIIVAQRGRNQKAE